MGWTPGPGPTNGNDTFIGTAGADTADGRYGSDTLWGGDGNDTLSDGDGGNDILRGEGGDDDLRVERNTFSQNLPTTIFIDGGVGNDRVALTATQASKAVTATLIGGDGDDWISISGSYAPNAVIDAGSGNDLIVLFTPAATTISLGAGVDTVQLFDSGGPGLGPYVITDFAAGDTGDLLVLTTYFQSNFIGWTGSNPFGASGYARLLQDGADTLLQVDWDGGANSFVTLFRLQNVNAAAITAINIDGYSPDGANEPPQHIIGTDAGEAIDGGNGNDLLEGLGGNDLIDGNAGNDTIYGGDGADNLFGGADIDLLFGGAGEDRITSNDDDVGYGGDGNDDITGSGAASIFGDAGDDTLTILGSDASETVTAAGGDGDDQFNLGLLGFSPAMGSSAVLDGGDGDDTFHLNQVNANASITMGGGRNTLVLSALSVVTHAVRVTDFAPGAEGDVVDWEPYLDAVLTAWDGESNPFGSGHARVVQLGGNAVVQLNISGVWRDLLILEGVDVAFLTAENFSGYPPNGAVPEVNTIVGEIGDNIILGTVAADIIISGDGEDELDGGRGDDTIYGGDGADELWGRGGDDVLIGGGAGSVPDVLHGGDGSDTFIYTNGNRELTIWDFDPNADQLVIHGYSGWLTAVETGGFLYLTLSLPNGGLDRITLRDVTLAELNGGNVVFYPWAEPPPAPTLSPPGVAPTPPTVLTTDLTIANGQTLYSTNSDYLFFYGLDSGPLHVSNSGEIAVIGTDTNHLSIMAYAHRQIEFHNTASGEVRVHAEGSTSGAVAFYSITWDFRIINDGVVEVTSMEWGAIGALAFYFTNNEGAVWRVWGGTGAAGVSGQMSTGLLEFYNGGLIEVIGRESAIGAEGAAYGWRNDGTIRAITQTPGASVGVSTYGYTLVNTGLIEADRAFVGLSGNQIIDNSGDIHGDVILNGGDDAVYNTGDIVGDLHLQLAVHADEDTVVNSGSIDGNIYLGAGSDSYDGAGGTLSGAVYGDFGADVMTGGSGREVFYGGEGDDVLTGGGGDDVIETGRGADEAHGGDGFDIISFVTASDPVQVDLAAGSASSSGVDQISGFEGVTGSVWNDTIFGAAGAEWLHGNDGDDTINGRDGDDTIIGGVGDDTLTGGNGADRFQFVLGHGDDVVTDFDAALDRLEVFGFSSYQSLQQVGADTLIFLSPYNTIRLENISVGALNASNLTFNVGAAPDAPPIEELSGSDTIYLYDENYVVVTGEELEVIARTGFQNSDSSPTGSLINEGVVHVIGVGGGVFGAAVRLENRAGATFFAETRNGDPSDNPYIGLSGSEVINHGHIGIHSSTGVWGITSDTVANHGTIRVTADAGAIGLYDVRSVLNTGTIEVVTSGASVGVRMVGSGSQFGITFENSGTIRAIDTGEDSATTGVSFRYTDGAQIFLNSGLIEAVNAFAGAGDGPSVGIADIRNTGVIRGRFLLGYGDDRILNAGEIYGVINFGDGANIYDGSLGIIVGAVNGGVGNDHFTGGAGFEELRGYHGDDYLDGGAGADLLNGGLGNDTYVIDNAGDVVQEVVGQGIDTVRSSITYGLGDALENLTLIAAAAINGFGNALNNTLTGNAAANVLNGQAGHDTAFGEGGNDTLFGADGDDVLDGGDNNDLLDGGNNNDTLNGGAGADTLYGRAGNDTLDGGAGSNTLEGGVGDDTYIVRGAGDVVVEQAASGIDTIISTATRTLGDFQENLTLTGVAVINGFGNILANVMIGNDAANTLSGLAGADTLSGGLGTDTLNGGDGTDTLNGGGDNDVLDGGNDADTLNGGDGADTLYGRTQSDTLNGEAGNDTIFGGDGDDVATGGDGDDLIDGLNNNDTLSGGDGADDLYGRQNNDVLNGDAGNDELYGGDGDDQLNGGADDDLLEGGNGIDVLIGGDGADTLYGRNGADTLDGGLGADTLSGGNDADTFVFSTALGAGNIDTIQFYSVSQDTIQLDVDVFNAIGIGTLAANAFVIGAGATTAEHRIIYNATTGALYYDADGDGAGAAVQFATLGTGLALTNADFVGGP